jgi:magnesium-transporting ATPase (P-type)
MQSLLTGESQAVDKHSDVVHNEKAVYQDKLNMLFSVSLFYPNTHM